MQHPAHQPQWSHSVLLGRLRVEMDGSRDNENFRRTGRYSCSPSLRRLETTANKFGFFAAAE